jgi:hypothetical protein
MVKLLLNDTPEQKVVELEDNTVPIIVNLAEN